MILKNAVIIDGKNTPAYKGHVVVENDRIVKILSLNDPFPKKPGTVIDCEGKTVAPGFIDAHSHNDFFAAKPDRLRYFEPFLQQGVTTMVVGNCGFSAAGYAEDTAHNDEIGGGLFSNDGNNYGSFAAWIAKVDGKMPVNMAGLVGHGTARIGVNGKAGTPLSPETQLRMEQGIEKALDEGAAGVSFGLMYEPGQFAPADELESIARLVRKKDKIVTWHARACSKVSTSYQPPVGGRAHNLRAMDEVVGIARKTGARTQYSHLIFVGKRSWDTVGESLRILEETKAAGYDIAFDMYPMEFGASVITVVLPVWYLGLSAAKRRTPITRARLWLEIFIATKALGFGFGDMLVSNTFGVLKELEGLRVTEIAARWKKSPFQTYLDLVEKTGGRINVLMYQYQNPAIIERLRRHPQSLYMSDAWIEKKSGVQNFACYYAFPKFLTLARDAKTPIEEAIRKMTGATAERFRIRDRGVIEAGKFADLVVFDLANLAFTEGKDAPPKGIELVLVNGRTVVRNGIVDPVAALSAGLFVKV